MIIFFSYINGFTNSVHYTFSLLVFFFVSMKTPVIFFFFFGQLFFTIEEMKNSKKLHKNITIFNSKVSQNWLENNKMQL